MAQATVFPARVSVWPSLTYVARRSPRATDRGDLADLFWRERHSGRARQSLRQVLLELKRVVGDGLLLDHNRVSLAPNTLALDAEEFERMVRAGHWRRAVEVWGGEFLSTADNLGGEDFRLWLESERVWLHTDPDPANLRSEPAFRELLASKR